LETKEEAMKNSRNINLKAYPLDEIGKIESPIDYPHRVKVHESFLRNKLDSKELPDLFPLFRKEAPSLIRCPFCDKGSLKLIFIKKIYDNRFAYVFNPFILFIPNLPIGEKLEYICTSCDGVFIGEVYWFGGNNS
jgi:hypothetical protein